MGIQHVLPRFGGRLKRGAPSIFTPTQEARIRAEFVTCESVYKMAEEMNVHHNTLRKKANRMGLRRRIPQESELSTIAASDFRKEMRSL